MSPVFLLFLDCIHQLVLQNPTKFGFNSTFLVVLSDALRLTAFDTFIFNNERERTRRLDQSEQRMRDSSWQSLPLWAWGAQYKPQDMKIFNNPLYMLQDADFYGVDSLDVSLVTSSTYSRLSASDTPLNGFAEDSGSEENDSDGASPLADENLQIRYNTRTGVVNLGGDTPGADKKKKKTFSIRRKRPKDDGDEGKGSTDNEETNGVSEVEIFNTTMQERMKRPLTLCKDPQMVVRMGVANMRWWSLCYHRWMPWSQSFGGGPSEMHRQESVLFDEIHALYCKIQQLKQSLEDDITTHPDDITTSSSDDSGMYFPHTPPVNPPHLVSNFYPYSPVQELGRKSVLGTPLFDFI
uniref:Myotubularin phosphatase domain-containing protein n=1 Tax=Ciona savignyi TaxID=51511 RepID=H2ZC68_CIOSA